MGRHQGRGLVEHGAAIEHDVGLAEPADGREAHEPQTYDWLHLEVERLSSLERQILNLRYGSVDGVTLKTASECIGIPRDRVKRIERRALNKLRQRVGPMLLPA